MINVDGHWGCQSLFSVSQSTTFCKLILGSKSFWICFFQTFLPPLNNDLNPIQKGWMFSEKYYYVHIWSVIFLNYQKFLNVFQQSRFLQLFWSKKKTQFFEKICLKIKVQFCFVLILIWNWNFDYTCHETYLVLTQILQNVTYHILKLLGKIFLFLALSWCN